MLITIEKCSAKVHLIKEKKPSELWVVLPPYGKTASFILDEVASEYCFQQKRATNSEFITL